MTPEELSISGYDPFRDAGQEYEFDLEAGLKPIRWIEKYCVHPIGKRRPFILADWQRRVLLNLFGWKSKEDGFRRYRKCFIFVPRKNGKTTFAAAIALYMLSADGENGARVYCSAFNEKQADTLFGTCCDFVTLNDALKARLKPVESNGVITHEASLSRIERLTGNVKGKMGGNAHLAVVDEYHEFDSDKIVDALEKSSAARDQAILLITTTAGHERNSPCFEEYDSACKIRRGEVINPAYLPVIFEATQEDDWTAESTHRKANPCWGESVNVKFFRGQFSEAYSTIHKQNNFRKWHLNQWVSQENRFLCMIAWAACPRLTEEDERELLGKPCFAGLDLSDTKDFTAFSLVWKHGDGLALRSWFWIPEDSYLLRNDTVKKLVPNPLSNCTVTSGTRLDKSHVLQDVLKLCQRYQVEAIAYDRWGDSEFSRQLDDERQTVVPWQQSYAGMSTPLKALESHNSERTLSLDENPLLTYMAENAAVKESPDGDIRIVKPKGGTEKRSIDGIQAAAMAIGVMLQTEESGPGIVVL